MKVAYCILCHKNTKVLKKCVEILSITSDVYIHIDLKSNIDDFKDLQSHAILIDKRINVRWGHISQIDATLELFKRARKGYYDYVFLLSGDCLPIKSNKQIEKFLKQNRGKEFIGIDSLEAKKRIDRIKYCYPEAYFKKEKKFYDKIIMFMSLAFKKKNKYFEKLPQLYYGTQWIGLTNNAIDYIFEYLSKNSWYYEAFKRSLCPDEMFFQTIIGNSKFLEKVYLINMNRNHHEMALRYVDWYSGPQFPKILNDDDLNIIRKKNLLFARKFSDNINFDEYDKNIEIY